MEDVLDKVGSPVIFQCLSFLTPVGLVGSYFGSLKTIKKNSSIIFVWIDLHQACILEVNTNVLIL